jgi:hypothetical protein
MFKNLKTNNRFRKNCGGVALRMILILLNVVLITGAVAVFLNFQQKNQERNSRKALEISEYGLLRVMERLGEKPSLNSGFPKTPYDGGWYSARLIPGIKGDTLLMSVEVIGHIGFISRKQQYRLKLSVVNGDSSWVRALAE